MFRIQYRLGNRSHPARHRSIPASEPRRDGLAGENYKIRVGFFLPLPHILIYALDEIDGGQNTLPDAGDQLFEYFTAEDIIHRFKLPEMERV